MGLIVDTSVFIRCERGQAKLDFSKWEHLGSAAISVVTASELLVGVHRADTTVRRDRRSEFVEAILSQIPILDFTLDIARLHAELFAHAARRGQMIGAHDLMIAATAKHYDYALLTANATDFGRVRDLNVISLPS
ncbi:MAG: type II toxin-antitoxin system VapC family toxin [Betaproteobacteria bacterium]